MNGQTSRPHCWAAWYGYDIADSASAIGEIQPVVDVGFAPCAIVEPDTISVAMGDSFAVDAASCGSIMNQKWRVFAWEVIETLFARFDVTR